MILISWAYLSLDFNSVTTTLYHEESSVLHQTTELFVVIKGTMKFFFLEKYICLTWVLQNVMYNIENNNSEHSFSVHVES